MKFFTVSQEVMNYLEVNYPNIWARILEDSRIIEFKDSFNCSRIIDKKTRYAVLKRQAWKCNTCGVNLKYNKNSKWEGEVAHIDHIFPYSRRLDYINGYSNISELSNLQALCPKCNLSKSKKDIQ